MHIKQLAVPGYINCSKIIALLELFIHGNEPLSRWITPVFFFFSDFGLSWPASLPIAMVIHGHLPLSLTLPASLTASPYTLSQLHAQEFSFLSCK